MNNKALKLGFYYHIPALQEGEEVRVPGFLGRFLDSLAEQCNHLTCFLHEAVSSDSHSRCEYTLRANNLNWVNLGPPRSALLSSVYPYPVLKYFYPYRQRLDALLLRGPTPLLPPFARAARMLPVILLLVGNYQETSTVSPYPAWRRLLIRLWAKWYTSQQMTIARSNLTFVNSHKLYQQLEPLVPNLCETQTTTLESDNFFEREDTCIQRPIHLLYTGRYSASKGLFEAVDALAHLVSQGEDVVLDLVGWPENGEEDIVHCLLAFAKEKGISERIIDHGYQPVGPALFAFYRKADIYIIASFFEGFPRTIWEAMAHSLPVVATSVGSIPAFIEGAAELVQPRNVIALANSITHLIHNSARRKFLIREGYKLAKQNTLKHRSEELIFAIQNYVHNKGQDSNT